MKLSRLVLPLLCSIFLSACNDKNSSAQNEIDGGSDTRSVSDGTSDGGGGVVDGSTPEQIKAAVERARMHLMRDKAVQIIFQYTDIEPLPDSQGQSVYNAITEIFNPSLGGMLDLPDLKKVNTDEMSEEELDQYIKDHVDPYMELVDNVRALPDFAEYFPKIEVWYQEDGACPSNEEKHADASVSSNDLRAKVCFSLKTPQRIPSQSIEAHVTGLWLHELSHMFGNAENIARAIEKIGVAAYRELTSGTMSGITHFLTYPLMGTFNTLNSAKAKLEYAVYYGKLSEADKALSPDSSHVLQALGQLGYAYGAMSQFVSMYESQTGRPNEIFYAPDVDQEREAIVQRARSIAREISQLLFLDASQLAKQETVDKVEKLIQATQEVEAQFLAIRKHYEPKHGFYRYN